MMVPAWNELAPEVRRVMTGLFEIGPIEVAALEANVLGTLLSHGWGRYMGAEEKLLALSEAGSLYYRSATSTAQSLTLATYAEQAATTAVYPEDRGLEYVTLGLLGEAGEIANKVKKVIRDSDGMLTDERREALLDEVGDVLWYWAMLVRELGGEPGTVAAANLKKLASRAERGRIQGDGDRR
jgi:NTP pyrophosphatase (non-canonical NTP hydrolase)